MTNGSNVDSLNYSDVLVIGGGVIGLSVARELHKRGVRRIELLEKGSCGAESSWAAGGILGPQAEADEGGDFFDICSESRDLYPTLAEELFDETGIDIELDRSGTLYLAFTDEDLTELQKRFDWQRKAGHAVEYLSADNVRQAEPFVSPDVRGALLFPNDWQVENRKLLTALKRYAELNGIEIRENSSVERLIVDSDKVVGAETTTERFTGDHTVLATGAWTSLIKLGHLEMPFKIDPVRGQMLMFRTAKRLFQRVIYSKRGYLVTRLDGRILAGSTSEFAGFNRSVTDSAALSIRKIADEIAPSLGGLEIADHWSGLRPHASDGSPVIGSIDGIGGLFIATAHYRNGILLAPLTAQLAAGYLIGGEKSQYFEVFGPDRFRPRSVGTVS
ncbi:MAG: glycine oxidase ThiO [Pyrinomonadaceae bacterium]